MNNNQKDSRSGFKRYLFNDTESFKVYWEKYRKKGIGLHSIINVFWVTLVFSVWSFVFIRLRGNFLGMQNSDVIRGVLIIGLVGGIIVSLMKWILNESRYKEIINSSRNLK